MSESRNVEAFGFMFGYFLLSVVVMFLNARELSLWLGINVALAVIPFILINNAFIRFNRNENKFDVFSIIMFVLFVFFLPNTFYMITDLIHIDFSEFYRVTDMGEVISYFDNLEGYILIIHLFISVVIGVYLGIKSLLVFDGMMKKVIRDKYTRGVLFVGLLVLSSFGIYIGRFLRFFSWDILLPWKLLPEIWESIDLFTFTFVILFTFTQYILFYGYKLVFEEEPFK